MKTILMETEHVSRHTACQIEVCDEMGADAEFAVLDTVRRCTPAGFTEKEIRKAVHTLTTGAEPALERFGPGMYRWREIEGREKIAD